MLKLQWDAKDNGGPFRLTQVLELGVDFTQGGLFFVPYGFRVVTLGAGVLDMLFEWTDPDGVLQSHPVQGIPDMSVTASRVAQFTMWKASTAEIPGAVFRLTVTKTLGGGSGSAWDASFKVFG